MREEGIMLPTKTVTKIVTIGLIIALSGCASARTKPCEITGVTITLVRPDHIDGYCDILTGNDMNDDGHILEQNETTLGCANKKLKHIAATNNDKTLRHEIQHLLNWYCGEAAP